MRVFLTTIVLFPICIVVSSSSSAAVNSVNIPTDQGCKNDIPVSGVSGVSSSKSPSLRSSCRDKVTDFSLPPYIPPLVLIEGKVKSVPMGATLTKTTNEDSDPFDECCQVSEVYGCCSTQPIGEMPQMTEEQSISILKSAQQGWNNGAGAWTQMQLEDRIKHIRLFVQELGKQREDIIHTLMWEIGKNYDDAEAEFDRTIQFINQTIDLVQSSSEFNPHLFSEASSSTNVFSKRNAIGIMLCLGPYNYPLNEVSIVHEPKKL